MEGITVLNETMVVVDSTIFLAAIFFGITIILGLSSLVKFIDYKNIKCGITFSILGIISLTSFIFLIRIPDERVPQQNVIIDESVSFKEFTDKYKIIDQQGKIFTIQQKVESR